MITLPSRPSQLMADVPSAASIAPTTPPMSACDELDGSPAHQVTRFHTIAPTRPAKTTVSVIWPASTIPPATVAATCSERNAPTKFRIAAPPTAMFGGRARVEIEVATTLAVSWKPFVKSKASAVAMTSTKSRSESTSGVLQDDGLEHVGAQLRGVDAALEALVDVLPADHGHRVDAVVEQRRHRLAGHAVAVVLEAVDLDRVVRDVAEVAQARLRLLDLARGVVEDRRQPVGLVHRRLDLVEAEVVGGLLDEVGDVVERRGELQDVLAVDRRDEGLVEAVDDVVGDPVAVLLAHDDVAGEVGGVRPAAQEPDQQLRGGDEVARSGLEQVEVLVVASDDGVAQAAHGWRSVDNSLTGLTLDCPAFCGQKNEAAPPQAPPRNPVHPSLSAIPGAPLLPDVRGSQTSSVGDVHGADLDALRDALGLQPLGAPEREALGVELLAGLRADEHLAGPGGLPHPRGDVDIDAEIV